MTAAVCALLKVFAGLSAVAFAEAEAKAEGGVGEATFFRKGFPRKAAICLLLLKVFAGRVRGTGFFQKAGSPRKLFPSPQKPFLSLLFCQ